MNSMLVLCSMIVTIAQCPSFPMMVSISKSPNRLPSISMGCSAMPVLSGICIRFPTMVRFLCFRRWRQCLYSSPPFSLSLYIFTRVRDKLFLNSFNCLLSSMATGNASGLFSKKQYVANAEQRFIMKLCIGLCRECTRFAMFFNNSLMHSMMYFFRSIILSHIGMGLFFIFAFNPCTRCIPRSKS